MNDRESRLTSFRRWLHQDRFRYWLTFAVAWATLQRATTPLGDRSGKAVAIDPFTIQDEQLAQLHRAGVAREYDVFGTAEVRTYRCAIGKNCSIIVVPRPSGGRR